MLFNYIRNYFSFNMDVYMCAKPNNWLPPSSSDLRMWKDAYGLSSNELGNIIGLKNDLLSLILNDKSSRDIPYTSEQLFNFWSGESSPVLITDLPAPDWYDPNAGYAQSFEKYSPPSNHDFIAFLNYYGISTNQFRRLIGVSYSRVASYRLPRSSKNSERIPWYHFRYFLIMVGLVMPVAGDLGSRFFRDFRIYLKSIDESLQGFLSEKLGMSVDTYYKMKNTDPEALRGLIEGITGKVF